MPRPSNSDSLTTAIETLSRMNEKLLQLSADIGSDHPTSRTLIKDLLSTVQSVKTSIQEHLKLEAGGDVQVPKLEKEIERLKLLLDVAGHFHSTLDSDTIATRILDSILGWVGAERGLILVQDPVTGEHLVKVGRELNETEYQSSEVAIPRTVVGQVLKERKPVYSTDVQGDHSLMAMASVRDLDVRSLACLPMILDDEIPGVIYFDYRAAAHKLGPDERSTLEGVCHQAAIALMNANRYQRAREWARKSDQGGVGRLIGTSPPMREVFELVNQVALSPSTSVLISGASGTGKELVARAIHDLSSRSAEPFVAVNCAALPSNLLESELFGYEKGAFTDAKTRHLGLIEQADDGTLFLDEIGTMAPALQSKMLRMLEERTFRRLGGDRDIPVDLRIIAATNVDIEKSVSTGEFREDLFYRLNVFPIALPPLSERGDDVMLIANAVIEELNVRLGTRIEPIDPRGRIATAFRAYDWPGNVRELRNVLERAMILSSGRELSTRDFPDPIRIDSPALKTDILDIPDLRADSTDHPESFVTLKQVEDAYIDRVLGITGGDRKEAAKILGLNPSTLYRRRGSRRA